MNVEFVSSFPGELVYGIDGVQSGVSILGKFKKEPINKDETRIKSSVGVRVSCVFMIDSSVIFTIDLLSHISSS